MTKSAADRPTQPADVGKGRDIALDAASAAAIAQASAKAGFPPPPPAAADPKPSKPVQTPAEPGSNKTQEG